MKTGLFIVSYRITTGLAGAPTFVVHLAVNTPNQTVSGKGQITNTSNPPLDIHTNLNGDYTYMTVMPNNSKILVVAEGYPDVKWPSHGGVGPVILPNTKLRMILEDNWESGTANFSFIDANGEWVTIDNAKVTQLKE
jgi:hypothetical protein